MEERNERLIRYLQDAHAAEVGAMKILEDSADDAEASPEVQALFREHRTITENQAARLEQRLEQLGSDKSATKGFFNTVMAKVADWMDSAHDDEDKTVLCVVKGYALENLEMGMYESLACYSESIGDTATASLARSLQAEERQSAEKLWPHIAKCARMTAGRAPVDAPKHGQADVY